MRRITPVVGINPVANRDVTHLLRNFERAHLVGSIGFFVNRVRRPHERSSHADHAGEKPLREVQLHFYVRRGDIAYVGMRERMVPDGVTFSINALGDARELIGLYANQKECGGRILFLQHIENLRSPLGIGAIVKSDGNFIRAVAIAPDSVWFGQRLKDFVGNQFAVWVNGKVACAMAGFVFNAQDFAAALHVHVGARWYVAELVGGTRVARYVPNFFFNDTSTTE